MAYVALKPCCFAGQRFKVGEDVPEELVLPGAAKNLVKMGVIAKQAEITNAQVDQQVNEPQIIPAAIELYIHAEEGDVLVEPTNEGLQAIFDVLNSNVEKAEPIIQQMNDGDALILLHVTDNRKSIKEAAEARAKEISEGAGEQ